VLLTLPSLGAGTFMDDSFLRLVISQPEALPGEMPHFLDTFCFFKGDPQQIHDVMEFGSLPWWIKDDVKGCFWRPLASLTHLMDHRLWPERVWLMHLQSVLWFGAMVLIAALLFRRLMGTTTAAGLAALLFAVEDAHITPAAWLANRNGTIACLFGLLALYFHHGWRTEGSRARGVGALVMFALALLSAEAGIAAMGYIAAYALILEEGPLLRRLLSLSPYAVAIVAWRGLWTALGYGVHNIPLYADPLKEPLEFIHRLVIGLPQMITGQFLLPFTELQVLVMNLHPWTWLLSALVAIVLFLLFWPTVKADRTARFWALGMLFALVPFCSTHAQTRNLLFVGVGAFGLLALWLTGRPRDSAWPRAGRAAAVVLVAIHLVIAPLSLPVFSYVPFKMGGKMERDFTIPYAPEIKGRDIIVVNHPMPFNLFYNIGDWAIEGLPLPAHARILSQGVTPLTIKRIGPDQLHLRASHGITDFFTHVVMVVSEDVKAGREVEVEGMRVKSAPSAPDEYPTEAVFTFDRRLEDPSLLWFFWYDGEFRRLTLPKVGQSVDIPGIRLPFGMKYRQID
jgi:hypothetical protein